MRFWTLFGLFLANILGRGPTKRAVVRGQEVEFIPVRRLIPPWAWAQTWGEVILVREDKVNSEDLCWLLCHEAVHLRQWRMWDFWFPFVYAWESLKAVLQGKDYYWDNPFEVEAYRECREGVDCQNAQGVALDDREGYYAILKDLLPAIAHLRNKGDVAEALALLSKALSALEEGEKKLGGGARPPGGLR